MNIVATKVNAIKSALMTMDLVLVVSVVDENVEFNLITSSVFF
ncbi:hypothetical protein [Neobacillus massiliamazoniensis]|nr:hypothetical protein [Neobacillus massiliamazoniensis]